MAVDIQLRPVTLSDARQLLEWRNDEMTRLASHNTELVMFKGHQAWLAQSLLNPLRKIYIAQYLNDDIGTLRADYCSDKDAWLLSWTLAPEKRGQGLAKHMVLTLVNLMNVTVCAEIKEANHASISIAKFAGFTLTHSENGVLHYSRQTNK